MPYLYFTTSINVGDWRLRTGHNTRSGCKTCHAFNVTSNFTIYWMNFTPLVNPNVFYSLCLYHALMSVSIFLFAEYIFSVLNFIGASDVRFDKKLCKDRNICECSLKGTGMCMYSNITTVKILFYAKDRIYISLWWFRISFLQINVKLLWK